MVREGGLGASLADLPVAGAAPEWMSEKAITIGQYFVASGVYTIFGVTFPIIERPSFINSSLRGWRKWVSANGASRPILMKWPV